MVTLNVNNQSYRVQKELLLKSSEWFEKALSDRFKEGKDLVLRFPGTPTKVIEYFLFWLFHDADPFSEHPVLGIAINMASHQLLAVQIWSFADEHLISGLRNIALAYLQHSALLVPMEQSVRRKAIACSSPD